MLDDKRQNGDQSMKTSRWIVIALLMAAGITQAVQAGDQEIIVQSTTSTKNSGLYRHLLTKLKMDTGVTARIVAVGTGQAIRNARNCDGDVLLVHARSAEEKFVAAGFGVARYNLMYNDFVFVGPKADPALIGERDNATEALVKIAEAKALFVSRGDDSGTHKKERSLWRSSGVDPTMHSGKWYRETGTGMGATLNIAVGMGAYTMVDRATWISFKNKGDFIVQVEGDKAMFNQYGVIVVNPKKCPKVKTAAANKFSKWLRSARGQAVIAAYRVNDQQLFFPNAVAPK